MIELPFTRPEHLPAAVEAVRAARAARDVVAVPTDTYYGLAVDPSDGAAVRRVYELKGREGEKALPVLGSSLTQLTPLVVVSEAWRRRLEAAWPAPLTVVLPARVRIAAGGATLAVRVPAPALLRALLDAVGPLTATSANRSGSPPTADPREVARALGSGLGLLLDGGDTPGGASSTLVDLTAPAPRLLRAGGWTPPASWGVKPA